ncbi:MAG: hypothetical protein J7K98_02255, partial [Candidatus Aenigmarchaeota archaeon]|nr:hypothetical protein [Candidatus Aenigmarchaeota archaeon]
MEKRITTWNDVEKELMEKDEVTVYPTKIEMKKDSGGKGFYLECGGMSINIEIYPTSTVIQIDGVPSEFSVNGGRYEMTRIIIDPTY